MLLYFTGVILFHVVFGDYHKDHHDQKIAQTNPDFAFKLFRQIASDHPSENLVISPFSISTSLGLLLLGTRSQTHDQIVEGLSFNSSTFSDSKDIHEGFHHLLDMLNDEDSELQLNIGNVLFIEQGRKILPKFLDDAKKFYHSETFPTDFQNSEEANKQINDYVEKKTNSKIPDMLSSVDQDTDAFLVNYIYARGQWENPFDEQFTRDQDFQVNENVTVKVPFMSKTGFFNVGFNEDNTVISLPYKGNASALFILPKEGKLKQIEEKFNLHSLKKWKKSLHREFVDLSIPKYSLSGSLDLKDVLGKLGVVDLFSDSADLSGITGEPNLKISKALHKAVLSVDEKGAEAAGSTKSEAGHMMLPIVIHFNRPFLLIMVNHESNHVMFSFRVANPGK